MFIYLLAFATEPHVEPHGSVVRNVQVIERFQAKGRVISGHEASARQWKPDTTASQREVIKIERDGRTILLRLTEFE